MMEFEEREFKPDCGKCDKGGCNPLCKQDFECETKWTPIGRTECICGHDCAFTTRQRYVAITCCKAMGKKHCEHECVTPCEDR